jgi:DNA-binding FadR family transcriptional regulator
MPLLLKILNPLIMKLAELSFGLIIKTISAWFDDYMANKKEKEDDRKIDEAIKNPDRSDAARRIDDIISDSDDVFRNTR